MNDRPARPAIYPVHEAAQLRAALAKGRARAESLKAIARAIVLRSKDAIARSRSILRRTAKP